MDHRERIAAARKIVIKVGTSTITHAETGHVDLGTVERLVWTVADEIGRGREVVVVSSGALGIGRNVLSLRERPTDIALRQACAAVGQARLMMIYEKFFSEYGIISAQILLTKETISSELCAENARRTFDTLAEMRVVPIVNENDAISVDQLAHGNFGDNDTLAAHVAQLVGADLLILLSDIDGLFTDDPKLDPGAKFIHTVEHIDDGLERMAKGAGSDLGTGGMTTKIRAAKIAVESGADMVIANGNDITNIARILRGERVGTLFAAHGTGEARP